MENMKKFETREWSDIKYTSNSTFPAIELYQQNKETMVVHKFL